MGTCPLFDVFSVCLAGKGGLLLMTTKGHCASWPGVKQEFNDVPGVVCLQEQAESPVSSMVTGRSGQGSSRKGF